jgi:hypothetical protein
LEDDVLLPHLPSGRTHEALPLVLVPIPLSLPKRPSIAFLGGTETGPRFEIVNLVVFGIGVVLVLSQFLGHGERAVISRLVVVSVAEIRVRKGLTGLQSHAMAAKTQR